MEPHINRQVCALCPAHTVSSVVWCMLSTAPAPACHPAPCPFTLRVVRLSHGKMPELPEAV